MQKVQHEVTLIFPFYNEMASIPFFRTQMESYMSTKNHLVSEIIMVNDGSSDNTLNELNQLATSWNIQFPISMQVIDVQPNQGKGNALKQGVDLANGDWLLTLDADLATMPDQLDLWVKDEMVDLQRDNHVYIASRELGIKTGQVDFQWHRRIIGRIFALMVRLASGLKLSDTQCGFKLYPKEAAKLVFGNLLDHGFAHDVEILYRLRKNGCSIISLPIKWIERGDSKVHLVKDSWNMFVQLTKLKKRVAHEAK